MSFKTKLYKTKQTETDRFVEERKPLVTRGDGSDINEINEVITEEYHQQQEEEEQAQRWEPFSTRSDRAQTDEIEPTNLSDRFTQMEEQKNVRVLRNGKVIKK